MSSHGTTALFFPSGQQQLFGILHEPLNGNALREGVVICSPAPHEDKKFHWTQRQIANRLQLAGYTVLRFDYFATGDSEGASQDYALEHCRQNIQDAIAFLKASGQVRRVTVVATRLGGLLALQALAEERIKRLVLIDPVLDGESYLKRMQDMHNEMFDHNPFEAPYRTPLANHRQLLGFPFSEALGFSMRRLKATATLPKAKSVLLLQTENAADLSSLEQHLASDVDEVQISKVASALRWDDLQALQFQDFPNELIQKAVDAVRGQA